MKTLITVLMILALCRGVHAQSGWVNESSNTTDNLRVIQFINPNTGWAVSFFEKMFRTTNGGTNWQQVNLSIGTNEQAMYFTDAQTGWVGGFNGKLAKTTDGGLTWTEQIGQTNLSVTGIKFINSNTGYASSGNGLVYKTSNGGTNWSTVFNNGAYNFNAIDVLNKDTVYACGANSVIYATTNGGTNWTLQNSGGTSLNSIKFVNSLTGYSLGDGTYKKTTNAGANWFNIGAGLGGAYINTVHFYNALTGWAAGYGVIKCTINGGANWFTQDSISAGNIYFGIFFTDNATGWACGSNGIIKKTTNGGSIAPAAPTNLNAAALSSTKVNLGWTDNSNSEFFFIVERSLNNSVFMAIDSVPANTTVYTDSSLAPNTGYFYRVYAVNMAGNSGTTNTAYAVTFPGVPSGTTLLFPANNSTDVTLTPFLLWNNVNGATNYVVQLSADSLFNTTLINDSSISNSIYPVSNGTLNYNTKYYWRVRAKNNIGTGPWSAVWNFRTIGLTGIGITQNEIPDVFRMYDNYPNPFNPSTQIKFDLPKASFVKIVIYDISGREAAIAVNGQLNAGKYSVEWNASNYASGVYFYRITAGNFTDVKKMILVK